MPYESTPPVPDGKPFTSQNANPYEVVSMEDEEISSPADDRQLARESDPLFQAFRSAIQGDAAKTGGQAWLLIGSLVLFALASSSNSLSALINLVVILFIHECGHYVGMLMFGYRDVKMFFIPFFGAAVSGRNESAPAWQQGIVLLLGPLPGIAIGFGIYALLRPAPGSALYDFTTFMVFLNAFNLLPLVPLDGGRLLEVLVFSRHPVLGTGFRAFAVAGLGFCAVAFGSIVFGILAGLLLISIPLAHRQALAARQFRFDHPDLPDNIRDLTDSEVHDLFGVVRSVVPAEPMPALLAQRGLEIHGQAVSRQAGFLATTSLLILYGTAILTSLVFVVMSIPFPAPP